MTLHDSPRKFHDFPPLLGSQHPSPHVTLPALQKNFVNIFFVFAWEFCIEKWRGFLVNFFCSPSPTKRSTTNPRNIWEKFGAKFGAKFGTKIRKIRKTFVVKNLCTFEPQIWLEIITSRDAKSTCFKGSQTSCTEMLSGVFWPKFGRKRSHHVMDAACWTSRDFPWLSTTVHDSPRLSTTLHDFLTPHFRSPHGLRDLPVLGLLLRLLWWRPRKSLFKNHSRVTLNSLGFRRF